MICTWAKLALVAAALTSPQLAYAQRAADFGVQVIATDANPWAVVGGPGAGLWLGQRVRLAGTAGLGVQGEALAWRLEGLVHFHLNPDSPGLGVYGGAGLAAAGSGDIDGYMVILAGVETSAAAAGGWFAEVGFGGGARLAAGYRWR